MEWFSRTIRSQSPPELLPLTRIPLQFELVYPGQYSLPGTWPLLIPSAVLASGHRWVHAFFACTGFLTYLPYATGRRELGSLMGLASFYARRLGTLLPMYYFFLLVHLATLGKDVSLDLEALTPCHIAAPDFLTLRILSPHLESHGNTTLGPQAVTREVGRMMTGAFALERRTWAAGGIYFKAFFPE